MTSGAPGPAGLFVRVRGSGRPLVVLHGGPDFDHEYLLPEADGWAESARVVLYDQRGRGRSFHGEGPDDVSLDGEIADLDAIRAWTGHDRVAILGHSFGGLLAAEYAIRHPDRVTHLVLFHSAPLSHVQRQALSAELAARTTPEQAERMVAIAADPRYVAGDIGLEAERYRLHFGRTVRDREVLADLVGRLRRAFTPESIVAARAIEDRLYEQTWSRLDYDLLPALRRLSVATLVVHGEDDFVPASIPHEIAATIPGARLEVLPTSHFSFIDRPTEVRDLISDFLAD